MEYELAHRDTGERVANGAGSVVWVDYGTGRSIPLPEGLKAEIRGFEEMS
jgi:acyl-CoA thioesterase FadM